MKPSTNTCSTCRLDMCAPFICGDTNLFDVADQDPHDKIRRRCLHQSSWRTSDFAIRARRSFTASVSRSLPEKSPDCSVPTAPGNRPLLKFSQVSLLPAL